MLEAELDTDPSYDKGEKAGKSADNWRNGHNSKTAHSEYGELDLTVPRDRNGTFEPAVVKKHQKNVTGKILPIIKEWQNRPLLRIYAIVFLDAIHFKVREDGLIQNKAAYMAIGVDLDGNPGCSEKMDRQDLAMF